MNWSTISNPFIILSYIYSPIKHFRKENKIIFETLCRWMNCYFLPNKKASKLQPSFAEKKNQHPFRKQVLCYKFNPTLWLLMLNSSITLLSISYIEKKKQKIYSDILLERHFTVWEELEIKEKLSNRKIIKINI